MDARFERFSLTILEISKYWHRLCGEEMQKYGLRGSHAFYLMALYRNRGGVTAPQLCEFCGKDKSDVSRMMKILQGKGMVVKEERYGGRFFLTEEGEKAAEHVSRKVEKAVNAAGCDLTEEQRNLMYGSLEQITVRLRKLSAEGIPEDRGEEITEEGR